MGGEERPPITPLPPGMRPRGTDVKKVGDWDCPGCGDFQFARNTTCRRCGGPRPGSWAAAAGHQGVPQGRGGGGRGDLGEAPQAPGGCNTTAEAGDWICTVCGDLQFRRNSVCRKCGAKKQTPEGQALEAQQQAADEAQAIQAALISGAMTAQAAPDGSLDAGFLTEQQQQQYYLDLANQLYGDPAALAAAAGLSLAPAVGGGASPPVAMSTMSPKEFAELEELQTQLSKAKANEEDLKKFNKRLDEKIEELENILAGVPIPKPPSSSAEVAAQLAAAQAQVQAQATELTKLKQADKGNGAFNPDAGVPYGHLVVEPTSRYFLCSVSSQMFEIGGAKDTSAFLTFFKQAVKAAKAAAKANEPPPPAPAPAAQAPAPGAARAPPPAPAQAPPPKPKESKAKEHLSENDSESERLMRTVKVTKLPDKVESSVIIKSLKKAFGEISAYSVEMDNETRKSYATVEFATLFAGVKAQRAGKLGPLVIAPSPVRCRGAEAARPPAQAQRSRSRSRSRSRDRRRRRS